MMRSEMAAESMDWRSLWDERIIEVKVLEGERQKIASNGQRVECMKLKSWRGCSYWPRAKV